MEFKGKKKAESKELGTIDLTQRLLDSFNQNPKPRLIGRYHISKLWSILNGYLPVEKYLEQEVVDFEGAMNMWQGTWKHQQIQSLLPDYQKEIKKVIKIDDFEIVGMCDAINDVEGLELKTSKTLHTVAKRWHIHQAKIYCTMFERETFKVVQPVVNGKKLYLNILEECKRNDKWFSKEMEKLKEYHNKLVKYANDNKRV